MIDQDMLDAMQILLTPIYSSIQKLEQGQLELKQDVQNVRESLEQKNRETQILVESIPPQIRLVAEQHTDIINKLDAMADYEETRSRVSTLENVVQSHTVDITELKKKVI